MGLFKHCTETLRCRSYNKGSDRFSCSDCSAFSIDFIVCDCGFKIYSKNHCEVVKYINNIPFNAGFPSSKIISNT